MRDTRIYSPDPIVTGTELTLADGPARHVAQSLRLRAGDLIVLFDGSGPEFPAELTEVSKARVRALPGEPRHTGAESPLDISIWQGLSRGTRMDYVMQKSTELGARRITPMLTSRCVVKLDAQRAAKRLTHWQNIAISAAEQSGRCAVPEISLPVEFDELMPTAHPDATRIIFDTEGNLRLSELRQSDAPVIVACGPEGGFNPRELKLAEQAGFRRVRLGPRILRTETAPVVALSLLQYLVGDLNLA